MEPQDVPGRGPRWRPRCPRGRGNGAPVLAIDTTPMKSSLIHRQNLNVPKCAVSEKPVTTEDVAPVVGIKSQLFGNRPAPNNPALAKRTNQRPPS
jgi:hypothetical protein